jgi:16S rRNA (guanine527-N7)-methyltransferase
LTNNELWLRTICFKNSLAITDIQLSKIAQFADLLKGWNRHLNLISRKDEENIWPSHLLISIALLFKVQFLRGARALDLGTGGGLPGIPLSIMLPEVEFVLLDSTQKKVSAVKNMAELLKLANVSVVCSRAEDAGASREYKGSFDAVIARAVSGLENLVTWGVPFLKKGPANKHLVINPGERIQMSSPAICAIKGGDTHEEVNKTKRLHPRVQIHSMDLVIEGGEALHNSGKRLIIVENE